MAQDKRAEIEFHKKLSMQIIEEECSEGVHKKIMNLIKLDFKKAKSVLDAGCGCGYGSSYISNTTGCIVVSFDISRSAILFAMKHYKGAKNEFLIMDGSHLAFRSNMFDAVCAFEVIEHIRNYKGFLSELHRVLKYGGLLILSTPNKKLSSPFREKPINPYHVKEFCLDELEDLLKDYFINLRIFGEFTILRNRFIRSAIKKLRKILPSVVKRFEWFVNYKVKIKSDNVNNANYFVIICSKGKGY